MTEFIEHIDKGVANFKSLSAWSAFQSQSTYSQSEDLDLDLKSVQKTEFAKRSIYELKRNACTKKWPLDVQPAKKSILPLMNAILQNHKRTTLRVIIGSYKFRCHMNVWQVHSTYFAERHERRTIRLPEQEVKPVAFYSIYYWLLSDTATLRRSGIADLFNAARFLGMPALIDQCWTCFDNSALFFEQTAFKLYREASKFSIKMLQQLMLSRISKFFLTLVASQDFLDMSAVQVIELLRMNNLGVNSEMEILMSCVHWLQHDWSARAPYLLHLLNCVRFKLLPPLFLRFLQTPARTQILNVITTSDKIKAKVNDAFLYVTTEIYGKENNWFEHSLINNDLTTPPQRRWIYDECCAYHHDFHCFKRQFVAYEDFLAHLRYLQHSKPQQWRDIQQLSELEQPVDCCSLERNLRLSKIKLHNSNN